MTEVVIGAVPGDNGTFHPLTPGTPGQMRVVLNVHGGHAGIVTTMEGLTRYNTRLLRQHPKLRRVPDESNTDDGIWRDALAAKTGGKWSPGTLASWEAARLRVTQEDPGASVGILGGQPVLVQGGRATRSFGHQHIPGDAREGRSNEFMALLIPDESAYAVRDVNTAIAKHNARRIKQKNLPLLYESGVRYKTEGSPELWWDAEEILAHGHDDCEGLAAYRAGELINAGHDAKVYARRIEGPAASMGGGKSARLFHAVTQVMPGVGVSGMDKPAYDDPSQRLGMPAPTWYLAYAKQRRASGLPL